MKVRFEKTENCNTQLLRVGTKRFAAVEGCFPTPEFNAPLTASRHLNSHIVSWKRVSCEQQLDLSVSEHDQRDVTDGMRTPWKLPVNVALKNYVCLSSACPEVPVESCFIDDPILFEVIRVFQPCACAWCCNTKTSTS